MNEERLPTLEDEDFVDARTLAPRERYIALISAICLLMFAWRVHAGIEGRLGDLESPTTASAETTPMLDTVETAHEPTSREYIEDLLGTEDADVMALAAAIDDARQLRVVRAMDVLARQEDCRDCTVEGLTKRWGGRPDILAEAILKAADSRGIDPMIMVAIAHRESRFDPRAKGDTNLGRTVMSCGPTQVRIDFKGRPTCKQLQDPEFAFAWTADELNRKRDRSGRINLAAWNGTGYEIDVWRDVSWLRERLGE